LRRAQYFSGRRRPRRGEPVGIPEHVTLVIAGSHERHACRVIWRKERRIGVAFAKI
jgi:hypothetical protein